MAWKCYIDLPNRIEFPGLKALVHQSDFSDNPQDFVIWLAEVEKDPVDNGAERLVRSDGSSVKAYLTDANPGNGHEITEVKLADSAAGLDGATAGADLDLGTQIISGDSGAREIHVRVTNAVAVVGVSTDIQIRLNECRWESNI